MRGVRPLIVKALQKTGLNKPAHHVYYSFVHGFSTATPAVLPAQIRALEEAVKRGATESGDYYEFGLFKGYSFWHMQHQADRIGLESMRFFGFDSFRGLPEVTGVDATDEAVFYRGQFACSKAQVIANLESKGVDWDRTVLVEGYFDRSLTWVIRQKYGMRPAAVALIDCDLYSSTRDVLRFLAPLIRTGTVLMMDDWNCFDGENARGQRLAMAEFLDRHPEITIGELFDYGDWGKVFVVEEVR